MAELNDPFEFWDAQFSSHDLTVPEDILDLARLLLPRIVAAPQARRKETSEEATRIIENHYPEMFIGNKLAVVASNALVVEKIILDEFLVLADTVDGPVYARGFLSGFRFVHYVPAHQDIPVPVYGLQMKETQLLSKLDHQPIAKISNPFLIPVQEITPLR